MNRKPVDVARVAAALDQLDALAVEHPEAFQGRDAAAWTTILEGAQTMTPEQTYQTAVRLPVSILERVDAYTERMHREIPGAKFTRTDAIRMLLVQALEAQDAKS